LNHAYMLGREQEKFSRHVLLLLINIDADGYTFRLGETYRSPADQIARFHSGASQSPSSLHFYKLAIDLFIFKDGKYLKEKKDLQEIGDYWESLDEINKWGGNWNNFLDTDHFQRTVPGLL